MVQLKFWVRPEDILTFKKVSCYQLNEMNGLYYGIYKDSGMIDHLRRNFVIGQVVELAENGYGLRGVLCRNYDPLKSLDKGVLLTPKVSQLLEVFDGKKNVDLTNVSQFPLVREEENLVRDAFLTYYKRRDIENGRKNRRLVIYEYGTF